jgi:hypothetical protein
MGLLRWSVPNWLRRLIRVVTSRSGSSAPAGYRFPLEVIAVAVHWYLRYGLSFAGGFACTSRKPHVGSILAVGHQIRGGTVIAAHQQHPVRVCSGWS